MQSKLLIIEDDRFIHELFNEKFVGSGIEVFVTDRGSRGYELAKKEHPDVILIDLILPDMEGAELIKKIRADKDLEDAKIIVITNVSNQKKVDEVMKLGVQEYYIKSNESFFEIVEMIKTYFSGAK
ncbi:response regulator [Patescibacteria group bacterium]|nr:response regulator [Patescibacteria group bacterium]